MRILGIISGALALLFILWIGFGFIWWQNNQDEVLQVVDQAVQEGEAIGRDSTDADCLQTYLDIMQDCEDMKCSIQNQVFLKTCLEYSKSSATLCATTPTQDSLIEFAKWAAQTCIDQQVENSHCAAGLQEVAFHCGKYKSK